MAAGRPAGLPLIVGGYLTILPIFALWMLPLSIVPLDEDVLPLRGLIARALRRIARRHPAD